VPLQNQHNLKVDHPAQGSTLGITTVVIEFLSIYHSFQLAAPFILSHNVQLDSMIKKYITAIER
jgi:hypothetical protein